MNLIFSRYGVSLIIIAALLLFVPDTLAEGPSLDTSVPLEEIYPFDKTSPQPLDESRPVLTGQVTEDQYLPPAFYGAWQVTGTLLSTNTPNRFKQKTYDIWLLQQVGNKIRLANPDTRSDSYITVNDVVDNTATFTCMSSPNKRFLQIERVTLTVNGNQFNGQNVYQIRYFKHNQEIRVEQALFTLTATKISGPTIPAFENKH